MTSKKIESGRKDDSKRLIIEMDKKLDYIIKLLREEELKYPYHYNYCDTFRK